MPRKANAPAPAFGAHAGGTLEEMRQEAARCRRCDLYREATQVVFGEGGGQASVLIVGDCSFRNHIFKRCGQCCARRSTMAKTQGRARKRKAAKRPAPARRGGLMAWYLSGAAVIAAAVSLDDGARLPGVSALRTASITRDEKTPAKAAVLPRPRARPAETAAESLPPFAGKWFLCTTQTDYCVIDGGTILYAGQKVRLADIDAPSVAGAGCEAERLRGGDAKLRLREILNEGRVTLAGATLSRGGEAGAAPRLVLIDGRSVGTRLVDEGLARPSIGKRRSWCG